MTGLDHTTDEVIELGMVAFRYSAADEITGVSGLFQSFHQPSIPIPAEVTKLTGITDEMVAGHAIDPTAVASFKLGKPRSKRRLIAAIGKAT